jgi:HEAT repeat protein
MHTTRLLLTALALTAFTLTACESPAPKKPNRPRVVTRAKPTANESTEAPKRVERNAAPTRSERSALREKALGILANTALGGSPEERANAVEALTIVPTRLAMVLPNALADENLGVRSVALLSAGKAKNSTFMSTYRERLRDSSPFVRAAAIYAIRKNGQNADPTPLASMLIDSNPKLRAHAAFILGELGDKSALGLLRDAAGSSISRANQAQIRVMDLQIAEARVKLGEEAAFADIRAALFPSRVEDLEATVLAIQLAGQLNDQTSVNRLIQLIEPTDQEKQTMPPEVRVAAAMALARLGQPNGTYIAREYFAGASPALRAQSAHLFGEMRLPQNLPTLERMLADPDGRVRVAAASAIVKTTDGEPND